MARGRRERRPSAQARTGRGPAGHPEGVWSNYPGKQAILSILPPVDSRTVAKITGVPATTINVWINRALIPGVVVGQKGVIRQFDANLVTHLAIMAAFIRIGQGAPLASAAALIVMTSGDVSKDDLKLAMGDIHVPEHLLRRGVGALTARDFSLM